MSYFHSIEPDFPAQSRGAKCGGFPVIFDKANVVVQRIDPKAFEAFQINSLRIRWRRLKDYLVLIIMLKPVGVFSIPPVGGTPGWLDVSHIVRLGSEHPEKGRGIESARTDFEVIGLLDESSSVSPELVECKYKFLESHF